MGLKYKLSFEKGCLNYSCDRYSSYLIVDCKDIFKIYKILKKINAIYEQSIAFEQKVYNGFTIIFSETKRVKIKNFSNWLEMKYEVPIIIKEISKYLGNRDTKSIKDIIVEIKSLKKGVVIK